MAYRQPAVAGTVGRNRQRLSQLLAENIGNIARNALRGLNLIKGITVTFEEFDLPPVQTKNLVISKKRDCRPETETAPEAVEPRASYTTAVATTPLWT